MPAVLADALRTCPDALYATVALFVSESTGTWRQTFIGLLVVIGSVYLTLRLMDVGEGSRRGLAATAGVILGLFLMFLLVRAIAG